MCVRFHVCDIARGWFLVRDSVARWANFSYAILPVREMCLQRACSWPWPCLSKQRMASREQEILLVLLRRRQKVCLNQMKLAVALSCSYVNFIPHDFLTDMVAVDSVHGYASLLWQEPGNPTRGMPWRQGIPGRIPLNTCCRSWKCIFSYAILRSHGNVFSRMRYRTLELARDIAHMENGPNAGRRVQPSWWHHWVSEPPYRPWWDGRETSGSRRQAPESVDGNLVCVQCNVSAPTQDQS